jgi:hypothetical protein
VHEDFPATTYLAGELVDVRSHAALRAAERLAAMSHGARVAANYATLDRFLILRTPAAAGPLVEWWESHVLAAAIADVRVVLDSSGSGTCELTADFAPLAGVWELPAAGIAAVVEALASGAFGGRLTADQRSQLVSCDPDGRARSAVVTGIPDLNRGQRAARGVVRAIRDHVKRAGE